MPKSWHLPRRVLVVPRVSFVTAMRSVAGPHRSSNQDSVGGSSDFAFVADGVGGHVGGDVASSTVTHHLVEALAATDVTALGPADLRALVGEANAALRRRAADDPALAGMATTFTGLFCGDAAVRVVHIGDSRAYRLRGGAGELVTHDDSLVQRLVDAGAISEADAPHHPQRNIILRSLAGHEDDADGVTVLELPAHPGDRWVVCSDGLTDELSDDDVVALAAAAEGPEAAADALLAAALAADARDNVTVAVCDVSAGSAAPRTFLLLGAAAAEVV